MNADPNQTFAAVDLGSNSFHMVIARATDGAVHVVDRLREPVRLAWGLNDAGRLDQASVDRALACLERFGERIRHLPADNVRAVGTNTLRKAQDAGGLVDAAKERLGHPIEIIDGLEEARLIYLGVAYSATETHGRRLVVDIGGGSTECIIGHHFEPVERDSLYMGCVSFSRNFFPGGRLTRERMKAAEVAAQLEVQSIEERYQALGWHSAMGASGTINAVASMVQENNLGNEGITLRNLKKLRKLILQAGHIDRLNIPGLQPDRQPVIAGGVAILLALFERLSIDRMAPAAGALREGLLYDLLGRMRHTDPRERTIQAMSARYGTDARHAVRVERTALSIYGDVATAWNIDHPYLQQMLAWACRLHEIGLAINHTGHHRHAAYLVENGDMPGFSHDDRHLLAAIIRGHRRKLRPDYFATVPSRNLESGTRMCLVLRLAVLLNRSRRSEAPVIKARARVKDNTLSLRFPKDWLAAHPLTQADLEQEMKHWRTLGWNLLQQQ